MYRALGNTTKELNKPKYSIVTPFFTNFNLVSMKTYQRFSDRIVRPNTKIGIAH